MSLRRSFGLAFLSSNANALIGFAVSVVLARLLTPTEIGVFSLAYVLVGIAGLLKDFGIGAYIVQEKELTVERVRAAFALMLTSSWALAGITALLSVPAAAFYKEPGVRDVMLVLAVNMMVIPFGALTLSYLRREMRFGPRLLIETGSALVSGITAIALARAGFGYMSLAWSSVVGTACGVVAAIFFRPKHWPWLPGLREIRRVFSFGGTVTGANLFSYFNGISPDLILGRVLGMEAVAYFGRAMGLRRIFDQVVMGAVGAVALPHLAQRHRRGESMREDFLRAAAILTGIGWPFFAVLAVLAAPSIRVLYGAQWDAAIPLVAWFSLAAILGLPYWNSAQFLLAVGHTRTNLRNEALGLIVRVTVLTGAALVSLAAVGPALVITATIGVMIWRPSVQKHVAVTLLQAYSACSKSFVLALASAAVAFVCEFGARQITSVEFLILMCGGMPAACAWVVGVWVLRHPLKPELVSMMRRLGPDRKR